MDPPHFKGSVTSSTTLTINANIPYPVVEDNYGGWNATNKYWVVPAGCGGLYVAMAQFKWNAALGAAPYIRILGGASNATAAIISANASSTASATGVHVSGFLRCNAGDQISVQPGNLGFTTLSDSPADNNFFEIFFYAQ